MLLFKVAVLIALLLSSSVSADNTSLWFPPDQYTSQREYESLLNQTSTPESLRTAHDWMCEEPHPAGSPGDQRMIEKLISGYEELGLDVQRHDFQAYLARPIDAEVEMILTHSSLDKRGETSELRVGLSIQERQVPAPPKPGSGPPEYSIGYNAYSGSGEATGEVVYANYGRKEDFEKLRELGVDCAGKIVITRYGGNFRGYKAKFAEAAGAAGLLIYTDPGDSGYHKGVVYPEGGWANETYIQRGSIKTLAYPGDPLTPFEEATPEAKRLDPEEIALPTIPVQPIGYGAARRVMSRMTGQALPRDIRSSWQGGLPLAYRLTGGDAMRVHIEVQQERSMTDTANVIATLKGDTWPEQKIIIGCHFDAWTYGAGDPHAGSIVVYEAAKSFATAADRGQRPKRTIVFANWGAEEFGIIGSTEWVEANRDDLLENAVAYINLDMAAMGPNFSSSSAPLLKQIIADATREVSAVGEKGKSVFESWTSRSADDEKKPAEPSFGNLGGGSDHVGLYCHLGVPSCSLGARGSDGVSYHSAYDDLRWYRQVVGNDYQPAMMLTRVCNVLAARLANASLPPFDLTRYATDGREHLKSLQDRAEKLQVDVDFAPIHESIDTYKITADRVQSSLTNALNDDLFDNSEVHDCSAKLIQLERTWLSEGGLPGRPWYHSLYAASDPNAGYAAWMFPDLRWAIEKRDTVAIEESVQRYAKVYETLTEQILSISES